MSTYFVKLRERNTGHIYGHEVEIEQRLAEGELRALAIGRAHRLVRAELGSRTVALSLQSIERRS